MTGFRFQAHTPAGEVHSGIIQASSVEEAHRTLTRQKLIPDSIRPEPKHRSLQLRRTPSPEALVQFTRQFATLVESAVPLLMALEMLAELSDDRPLHKAVEQIAGDVKDGGTLADSMRKHPRVFDEIYVNVVEAGEGGGTLDTTLNGLADYQEQSLAVQQRVRAAMIYPSVILLVALGSVAALLTLVVPTFEGMFAASGMELPFVTLMLVNAADFVGANSGLLVVGALTGVLFLKALLDWRPARRVADRLLLATPLFGRLARKVAVARLSRTVSSLLDAGVPVLDALTSGARTTGNLVLHDALIRSRGSVAMGLTVSDALASTEVLPDLVPRMVQVGEQTGRLPEMLAKVADFYEREVDTEVDGLLKALEPALVVLVGVLLGGIVVAMYLPIFDAVSAVDAMPR